MHVAIIMNGNGHWATQRGLPPPAAGPEGVTALRNTVALAKEAGVKTLTLYAICTPGCARPRQEVDADLSVLGRFLRTDVQRCREQAVRISVIGSSERLRAVLPRICEHTAAWNGTASLMHLRLVVDYSAHDSITKAAWRSPHPHAPERFNQQLREIDRTALPAGAVDLLVRTGGGRYQSDFMLWEAAYARLHYVDSLWPDFTVRDFQCALDLHTGRDEPIVSIA
jgi:undecaprenyl diphosphate synthase